MNFTRKELRGVLVQVLGLASILARLSPTPKDDAAVAMLLAAVLNDDTFARLCDLLGVPE